MSITIEKVLETIEADDRGKVDQYIPTKAIHMDEDGKLTFGNHGQMRLTEYAQTQAFTKLGIPTRFGKKLIQERPDILADTWNHFAGQDERTSLVRMKDFGEYGEVRGILSDEYSILDNNSVKRTLTMLHEKFEDRISLQSFHLDDHRMHIRIVFDFMKKIVGLLPNGNQDIVELGTDLINSEVGASSLVVSPLIYRLVCTNGLRAWTNNGDVYKQRHIHLSNIEITNRMNMAIANSAENGAEMVKALIDAKEEVIVNPFDKIDQLADKWDFTKEARENVKFNFQQEPNSNLFGIINAVTRTARDLPNERRLHMETLAGTLLKVA